MAQFEAFHSRRESAMGELCQIIPPCAAISTRAFQAVMNAFPMSPRYVVTQLDQIPPVPCPCGQSRRGFAAVPGGPATVHVVDISAEARTHYHKTLTEIYVILEGEGFLELDGERVPVKPMTSVMIRPGCKHRAVGQLKVLNLVIPSFDPADEHFD